MKIKNIKESFENNATANLIKDHDTEGLAMSPDYKQAAMEGNNIKKTLENRFKDKNKEMQEFVKLTLDESLFEDTDNQNYKNDSLNESFESESKLYKKAEVLADNLSEFLDATSRINNVEDYLDEYDFEHLGKSMDALYDFARAYSYVTDNENVYESLTEDIKARYIVLNDDGSVAGVPCESAEEARELACQKEGRKVFTLIKHNVGLKEAADVLEKPQEVTFYYKNKRDPLSEIIQDELTWGELVYKRSPKTGKLNPTQAPSLNINAEDIGAGEDDRGTYIIGNTKDRSKVAGMEDVADRYALECKSGENGSWYFTKIYLDEKDFTRPYVDLDAPVVADAKRDI